MFTGMIQDMDGCCGIQVAHGFKNLYGEKFKTKEKVRAQVDGTGYLVAAFIDNKECEQAYTQLSEWFPIMYQSEPRVGLYEDTTPFFVVFDTK